MDDFNKQNEDKNIIDINTGNYTTTVNKEKPVKDEQSKLKMLNVAKVFIWFGIGLLITGVIAIALPNIFYIANEKNAQAIGNTYYYLYIVSAIGILPLSIIMAFSAGMRKNKLFVKITYILYTIFMGILLSAVMLMLLVEDYEGLSSISALNTFAYTFLITAALFIICGLVGVFTKNMNKVLPLLLTLVVGSSILSLVNFFLRVDWIYYVVDFIMFFWILIVTALDMHNLNQIAERVDFKTETNLAIYLAYQLYVDFIYIFLRILFIIVASSGKKR